VEDKYFIVRTTCYISDSHCCEYEDGSRLGCRPMLMGVVSTPKSSAGSMRLHGARSQKTRHFPIYNLSCKRYFYNEIHGSRTRRFIAEFTTARHRSLSWAGRTQYSPQPISLTSILIPYSHLCLGLPSGHFPSRFPGLYFYGLIKIFIIELEILPTNNLYIPVDWSKVFAGKETFKYGT
jgi:hypothetical protein